MSKVNIPPAIARHSFIRRYPRLDEIRHILDSTGPHARKQDDETDERMEKIRKLKAYINTDTSTLLPKFRGVVDYRKEKARNALGKILAGHGKKRRKRTKRRKKSRKKKTRKHRKRRRRRSRR